MFNACIQLFMVIEISAGTQTSYTNIFTHKRRENMAPYTHSCTESLAAKVQVEAKVFFFAFISWEFYDQCIQLIQLPFYHHSHKLLQFSFIFPGIHLVHCDSPHTCFPLLTLLFLKSCGLPLSIAVTVSLSSLHVSISPFKTLHRGIFIHKIYF